jgi:uncharacterized membrane protein (DUF2068 family)
MGSDTELLKRPAPTLYGIIVFKLVKGALFLTLAIVLFCLSDDTEKFPNWMAQLLHIIRIHPANKFFTNLADLITQFTESGMLWASAGTLFYSLFSLVEGVGLMFRVSWAGWMAIGESAFFIPIEFYELMRPGKANWFLVVILITNIIIVWYLVANRHRLFRHHLHHGSSNNVPQADVNYE